MRLMDALNHLVNALRLRRFLSLPVLTPDQDPNAPPPSKPKRGRPAKDAANKVAGTVKVPRRRKRRVRRARINPATGKAIRRKRRKAAGKRAPRRAATPAPAAPTPPATPRRALVPASKGALVVFKAKAITAERFFELAQIAKDTAKDALGLRWDLVEGHSQHLMVPSRYRSFKTERGTRIRISGDRRYPAPQYWPRGELPPLVMTVTDYRWEGSARRLRLVPRERWLTFDGPTPEAPDLELVPEVDIEDERAALAEAEAAD